MSEQLEAVIGEVSNLFSEEAPVESEEAIEEEVTEEVISEDAEEAEEEAPEEPGEEDPPQKESRAQKRIRELVADKNDLKAQLSEIPQLREMVQQLMLSQTKPEVVPEEIPHFEDQAEYAKFIEDRATTKAQEMIKEQLEPLQSQQRSNAYTNTIERWFVSNPAAREVQKAMDDLSAKLSNEERAFYENQIIGGNTSILDILSLQANSANSGLLTKATKAAAAKAALPSSKKATKSAGTGRLSNKEAVATAYKNKKFQPVLESMMDGMFN